MESIMLVVHGSTATHLCQQLTVSVKEEQSPLLKEFLPISLRRTTILDYQLQQEFIDVVPDDNRDIGHYIPHHPVYKESSTTPIRIVYDCSCSPKTTQLLQLSRYWSMPDQWLSRDTDSLLNPPNSICEWHWKGIPQCQIRWERQRLHRLSRWS